MENNITVTSPLLPNLDELNKLMQDIWNRKWITNMGHYHEMLEAELAKYLGVEYISLYEWYAAADYSAASVGADER